MHEKNTLRSTFPDFWLWCAIFGWVHVKETRKMTVSAYWQDSMFCFLRVEPCNGVDVSWFLLSHLIPIDSWCFAS